MNTDEIINKLFSCSSQEIVSTIMGINRESFIFQLHNYSKAIVTINDWGETEFYVTIIIIVENDVDQTHLYLGDIYKEYFEINLKRFNPHVIRSVLCSVDNKVLNEEFIDNHRHPDGPLIFYFFDSEFNVSL
ncbi:hypothetical protein [Sphingobacterium sp. JUb56]|uniref:hypothetical protein n=1 Tax=Sphingobacterium sp. JUb56 TaxID=2587145 RepID=UPI00161885E0|nr:hypothetical protein [Sphingobacterium sp. JUb56]MBB2951989.1 hypothetical protein [Sphingobacterium sp. JUb56]